MAEDRTQIRPINPRTIRRRLKTPEPYRLGGSGGSGKNPDDRSGKSGDEPVNPFEAFFSSLAGGDMNALAAQLQSALRCSAAPARCSRAVRPMPGRG